MELSGKVAIVTGGSRGIGSAITLALAGAGADVAINYSKSRESADEVISQLQKMGVKGLAVQADVRIFSDAEKMIKQVKESFGRLDILVNNAGINMDSVIWKMTEEQWDGVIAADLKGYFNYIRMIAPVFKEQGSGKIVNITSINGLRGKFGQSNYSAAKAGIIGLTKAIAKELGRYNVNVNAVAPGLIETEMMKNMPEDVKKKALDEIVLGRLGLPDDVANIVVFLCTDKARHITGEVIKVDGGQYI